MIDRKSRVGTLSLCVEAWGNDPIIGDMVGSVIKDARAPRKDFIKNAGETGDDEK